MPLSDSVKSYSPPSDVVVRLKAIVGDSHVLTDPATIDRYARSSSVAPVPPIAIVRPDGTRQVQEIVRLAAEIGLALHPIARGCNWGYGDACAPTAGQVIVDLGRMNRILELNPRLAYVVIEPGVSQGELWEHLQAHAPHLWMDSTGAGPDASLVGNTLDRGFGHTRYGDHFLATCGMEVVLGDGRVLNTGFGHYPQAKAQHVYRYGVGPFLDGLFVQSNFGIVTRIGLWLMPRPEAFTAFFFSSPDEHGLEDIIERLAPLRMQGMLPSAIHIANDLRLLSARTRYPWERANGQTPLPDDLRAELRGEYGIDAWTAGGAIGGPAEVVAATKKALRRAVRPHRVAFLDDARLAQVDRLAHGLQRVGMGKNLREKLATFKPVYGLMKGEPTSESLYGATWRVRGPLPEPLTNPLDAHAGIMWSSPILPATGEDARRLMNLLQPIYTRHGFEGLVTFTMINERAMVAVTNLCFDTRETEEARRAAACYDEIGAALMDQGYPPYRTGPAGYAKLRRGSSVFWDVVDQLRQIFDPQNVVSPGRYEPGA